MSDPYGVGIAGVLEVLVAGAVGLVAVTGDFTTGAAPKGLLGLTFGGAVGLVAVTDDFTASGVTGAVGDTETAGASEAVVSAVVCSKTTVP